MSRSRLALAVVAAIGCASPQTSPSPYASRTCPLPAGARGYPVSTHADGASLPPTLLTRIAGAIAEHWDWTPHPGSGIEPPDELLVLAAQEARGRPHWRDGWVPRAGDTASVALVYRRRALQPEIRPAKASGFAGAVVRALTDAREASLRARTQRDTLPLVLPGPEADSVIVLVRFGAEPAPGDGVTRFSAQERHVEPIPGNPAPRYPDDLRSAGTEGDVLVHFIVRPDSLPDLSTLSIDHSSALGFSDAVTQALRRSRFAPALLDCTPVSELVELPYNFSLERRP